MCAGPLGHSNCSFRGTASEGVGSGSRAAGIQFLQTTAIGFLVGSIQGAIQACRFW